MRGFVLYSWYYQATLTTDLKQIPSRIMIVFACGSCEHWQQTSDELEGQNAACPKCGCIGRCYRTADTDTSNRIEPPTIQVSRTTKPRRTRKSSSKQRYGDVNAFMGIAGAICLSVGVFMPIFTAPIVGSVNLFRNGTGDGAILLALAAFSFVACGLRAFRVLWFTGLGSIVLLSFIFIQFREKMADIKSDFYNSSDGSPFDVVMETAIESIQMQWGWGLLVAGSLLIVVAAAYRPQESPNQ